MQRRVLVAQVSDAWTVAAGYEAYVGRWSREVAAPFLAWAKLAPATRVLDVGCGTGALSAAALRAGAREVMGIDTSAHYVADAARQLPERGGFAVADARSLPVRDAEFDAAVSGLVLNFVAEPDAAVAEMARVVRPGGLVAFYLWDYAGAMQTIRQFWDASTYLRPEARALDEGRRFPFCAHAPMRAALDATGLSSIEVSTIDVVARWPSFDAWWAPFLTGQGPAPGYAMSLPESDRRSLRELLRSRLPAAADGSITLTLRALAAKATKP